MDQTEPYYEQIRSGTTESLFVMIMVVGLLLFLWQWLADGVVWLTVIFFLVFLMFLFYSINYHALTIRLTRDLLVLKFGLFTWKIYCDNIMDHYLDQTPLTRVGGAGIHFTMLNGRYRAFFNFLEYPRVVVVLKQKKGPVKEIAFSTRHPDEIRERLRGTPAGGLPV